MRFIIHSLFTAVALTGCQSEPAANQKATRELPKETGVGAKTKPAFYLFRKHPDDSRPEAFPAAHDEAMDRPNVVFIPNDMPPFSGFSKAYYVINNEELRREAQLLMLKMNFDFLKMNQEILRLRRDDEGVRIGMGIMNAWADQSRKDAARLRVILGE